MALRFSLLLFIAFCLMAMPTYAEQTAMFSIQSSSFHDKENIPVLHTCDGKDLSPQLSWHSAPASTQSFVLICEDPDAPVGTWYHWVMYNLPSTISKLPQGAELPPGAVLGKNSWGRAQYNGPCPPASSTHRYIFTLYALDKPLALSPGAGATAVLQAIQGHVLAKATMMGVFGH